MAEPPLPREPASGDILDGRYRLVARLGRGGFGDVWRAEELLPGGAPFRDVALKLLSGFTDAATWTEEAKLLASFRHASLVTIYAADILREPPRLPFVSMELLEGETLADRLRRAGPVAWRRVLRWALDVAAALDVIHARGVVHLDLKPANLFLTSDGALKVLDFGIARRAGVPAVERGASLLVTVDPEADTQVALFATGRDRIATTCRAQGTTTMRAVVGTPGFMAPEVLELAEPTAATDAYALAATMVQLATGRLPHAVDDEPASHEPGVVSAWWLAIREATLRGRLRDLAADPAGLPRALVAVLERLLATDPAARGVTPGGLRAVLDEVWARPHGVPDPPFPGLAALGPEADGMLFGRDEDVARLGRELEHEPCVVLQGARGAGKTSLALAGLVPHLARVAADGKDDWIAVRVRPGDDPDRALALALSAVSPALGPDGRASRGAEARARTGGSEEDEGETSREAADASAGTEGGGFHELAAFAAASRVGIALVVDPLEEAVAAGRGRAGRLLDLLAAIASARLCEGLRAVAALGEEHAPGVLSDATLGNALRPSVRLVGPPAASSVRDIVARPARLARARIVGLEAVVGEIERELRSSEVRLPFVALALAAWWATREKDAAGSSGSQAIASSPAIPSSPPSNDGPAGYAFVLRAERWHKLGGVVGGLAAHAEAVLGSLDDAERVIADEMLLRLSTTEGTRVRWGAAELLAAVAGAEGTARAERVLEVLARAHLVRRLSGERVEIAHEALIGSFRRLEAARLANIDRLVFLERLREAAEAWDRSGSHPDFLWSGALLAEARRREDWIARGATAREKDFVRESRQKARFRFARRAGTTAAVAAIVVLGTAAKAITDERSAEAERLREAAERRAELAELEAAARRSDDPYRRVAWIAAAMEAEARGQESSGALPLELVAAARDLPRAHFLALGSGGSPAFPWDGRFAIAASPGGGVRVVDLAPSDTGIFAGLALDADPLAAHVLAKEPRVTTIEAAPDDPIVERVPLSFDTAFVTRSVSGEVRVYRLRPSGAIALAAVAPVRCAGAVRAAAAAPVVACATDEGIARWDLRAYASDSSRGVDRHPFAGNVLDVSADGRRVAAVAAKRLLAWAPDDRNAAERGFASAVLAARYAPRGRLLAVAQASVVEVIDAERPGDAVVRRELDEAPVELRWDPGGLHLATCAASGLGRWHDLRERAEAGDRPNAPPCGAPNERNGPARVAATDAAALVQADLGPHELTGGFALGEGWYMTRDLVLLRAGAPGAERALRFRGTDEIGSLEEPGPLDSVACVIRESDYTVAWQVGATIHLYAIDDGRRLLARPGNLLRRCLDGRVLAWVRDGDERRVFDLRDSAPEARLPREPGFVLNADAACHPLRR